MLKDSTQIKTYQMSERSEKLDFEIRDWQIRNPIVTPHRHEFFQIHINVNGDSKHGIRNIESIYPNKSIIFILPYRVHYSIPAENPDYHIINFNKSFLNQSLNASLFETEELIALEHPEIIPFLYQGAVNFNFNDDQFAYIMDLVQQMHEINRSRSMGWRERIRGCLLNLIGYTVEIHSIEINHLINDRSNQSTQTESFKRVIQFIDKNISSDLTLETVAHSTFLSANYISQLLKQKTGLAFVGWLTMKRMEKAQELLLMTDMRISQIAKEIGFFDEAYFTRRFKQKFNHSPSEFRAKRHTAGR